MQSSEIQHLFSDVLSADKLIANAPMRDYTTFKIGGPADLLALPETEDEIRELIKRAKENNIKFYILGNGSNTLVKDGGIRGLVIYINSQFNKVSFDGELLTAQAGITMSALAKSAMCAELAGLEFASGIPGTIGGGVYMNAGAYNGEIGDLVQSVTVLDENLEIKTYNKDKLNFSYRNSSISKSGYVILSVTLKLEKGNREEIDNQIKDYTRRRRERQPLEYPNAGSMFKRPQGAFAAALIDNAGLKGTRVGDAQISTKHCGFFINLGNATAKDVLGLVEHTQKVVLNKFGILLEPEVKIIGED